MRILCGMQLPAFTLARHFKLEHADVTITGARRHAAAAQRLNAIKELVGGQGRPPQHLCFSLFAACQ